MKRLSLLCLFLAVVMLLSGCQLIDVVLPGQTSEKTPAPTAEPKSTPEPTPVNSSTTDSGMAIRVDYSQYEPSRKLESLYTRKSEEWMSDLEADSSCNAVYPYIGGVLYSSFGNGETYALGHKYGMVDDKGCILTDPVYLEVTTPTYIDYETGETVNAPFWVMTKVAEPKEGEESWWANEFFAVATLDGHFVTECKYKSLEAGDFGVCIKENYESSDFLLIDKTGNIILDGRDVSFRSRIKGEFFDMRYGDGLFVVSLGNYEYYFMDLKGNLVLGPYQFADTFRNGRACVRVGDYCGIIDKEGNWIVEPDTYTDLWGYSRGYCGGSYRNEMGIYKSAILDRDGNRVLDGDCDVFSYEYNGRMNYGYSYNGDDVTTRYYDENWNLIASYEGFSPMGVIGIAQRMNGKPGETEILSLKSGKTLTISEKQYYYGTGRSSEGWYDFNHYLVVVQDDEEERILLYDPETLTLLGEYQGSVREIQDPLTGEFYLIYRDLNNVATLMTLDRQIIGSFNGDVMVFGGMIHNMDGKAARYQDGNREAWFCLPLPKIYDD